MINDVTLINNRIKILGYKKKHVAKQVQCSPQWLSKVLNHKGNLSQSLKIRLFAYLSIK